MGLLSLKSVNHFSFPPLFVIFADVDECQSSDACRSDHVCNNTIGSYTCECAPGFTEHPLSQSNLEPLCNGKEISTHYLTNIKYINADCCSILHQGGNKKSSTVIRYITIPKDQAIVSQITLWLTCKLGTSNIASGIFVSVCFDLL